MLSIRVCKAKESEGPKPNRADRCMPKKKFRFNEAAGKCEDYSIKGCKANRDSYATREECEIHCSNIGGRGTPSKRPLSNLPLKRGKSRDCNLPTQVSFPQCGNFIIFLSFKFCVKSILENLEVQNLPF